MILLKFYLKIDDISSRLTEPHPRVPLPQPTNEGGEIGWGPPAKSHPIRNMRVGHNST